MENDKILFCSAQGRQDLAKFGHFGLFLQHLAIFSVHLVLGKILNLLWQIFSSFRTYIR